MICGGIGGGAQIALAEAEIKLYGGVSGDADEAVSYTHLDVYKRQVIIYKSGWRRTIRTIEIRSERKVKKFLTDEIGNDII